MTVSIRQNNKIKGIHVRNEEIKLAQYADDTNGILTDLDSVQEFFTTIAEFGRFSGLKINKNKTEAMWLGSFRHCKNKPLGISWSEKPIRVLGIYISYDENEAVKNNFDSRIKEAEMCFNMWNQRNLTCLGRIHLVKTFIISKFIFVSSLIPTPDSYIKVIDRIVYKFIWGGKKPKLNKNALSADYSEGGLRAPVFSNMIQSSRVMWLKRYLAPSKSSWKLFFEEFTNSLGCIELLLSSNYQLDKLPAKIPAFYAQVLESWLLVRNKNDTHANLIWNNSSILIGGKSVYWKEFLQAGIWFVQDLYNKNNQLILFEVWMNMGISPRYLVKWAGLINCVAKGGKRDSRIDGAIPMSLCVCKNEKVYNIETVNSALIYSILMNSRKRVHYNNTLAEQLNCMDTNIWKESYLLLHSIIPDTKTKVFQYRILHNFLAVNYWLKKWGIKEDDSCALCNQHPETIPHLFCWCYHSKRFWNDFEKWWLRSTGETISINSKIIIFGDRKESHIFNFIVILGKQFIFNCRENMVLFINFISFVRTVFNLEEYIARNNGTMPEFIKRWGSLLDVFDN